MPKINRETPSEQTSTLMEQADKYFREGKIHEKRRELEQARKKYAQVKIIAIDYPGISEAFKRVDDAIELIWALQNSANRRTGSKSQQSTSVATASKPRKSRLWWALSICFFLQLIIIGAALFYTDNLSFMLIKKNIPRPIARYDENKHFETNEKESLPSVPVISSSQVDYKQGYTKTSRKTSPVLQEEVNKDLSGTDSGQPRQTIPLTEQQKKPATIIHGKATPAEYFYTVQTNDTLGRISQEEYGTSSKWPTIANANKDLLGGNPNRLKVGMILVIPTLSETSKTLLRSDPSGSLHER